MTVLNPKFRLLTAQISPGTTHELAKAIWPVSQLSKLLRRTGLNVVVPLQLPPMPEASYALALRYTWNSAPNGTGPVLAEMVDVLTGP